MDARFYNSLTEGDFGSGPMLCEGLVEGDFWARGLGCYNVYRGSGHIDSIDYEHIVATADSRGLFALPNSVSHQSDTDYFYSVRAVSITGKSERGTMAMVRLSLDEQGQRRFDRPNQVRSLTAEPAEGGKIRLGWWYCSAGQQAEPVRFCVFGDGGAGSVDYETVLRQVEYTQDGFYSWLSSAGLDGKTYRFGVRSVAVDGTDDRSMAVVGAVVDLSGPVGVGPIRCEVHL